jgi:hypothetical protein
MVVNSCWLTPLGLASDSNLVSPVPLTELISALELTDHAVRTSQPLGGPMQVVY